MRDYMMLVRTFIMWKGITFLQANSQSALALAFIAGGTGALATLTFLPEVDAPLMVDAATNVDTLLTANEAGFIEAVGLIDEAGDVTSLVTEGDSITSLH